MFNQQPIVRVHMNVQRMYTHKMKALGGLSMCTENTRMIVYTRGRRVPPTMGWKVLKFLDLEVHKFVEERYLGYKKNRWMTIFINFFFLKSS